MKEIENKRLIEKGYRLPWKNNDNPQCFLEITRKCNARCKSCYQKKFLGNGSKDLDTIKREVDHFIKAINPSAICIVGGEPLEHTELCKIIEYIKKRGLIPVIFSNVINLNEENLKDLVRSGLKAVYAHIDSQTRKDNEINLMKERDRFANLLRKHKRKIYGLISCIVHRENIEDIDKIQAWAYKNSDIIKYCIFTIDGHKTGKDDIEVIDIIGKLKERFPNFIMSTYLKGVTSDYVHWGQGLRLGKRYLTPKQAKFLNKVYRLFTRKYVSILSPKIFKFFNILTTVIVRPHKKDTLDFCESCPDQTIIWVKDEEVIKPLVIHSCVSPDYIINGYNKEEQELEEYLKGKTNKKIERSKNSYHGNVIKKNMKVINKFIC